MAGYPDPSNVEKMGPPPSYFATEGGHPQFPQPPPQTQQVHVGFVGTPMAQGQGQHVITAEPGRTTQIVVVHSPLTHFQQRMICPHCRADINTSTRTETGCLNHVVALILCIVGCWPCCLIPYCCDGCSDTIHKCPNCKRTLGIVRRM